MSKFLKKVNIPKLLYLVFIITAIGAMTVMPVSAADIWDKASEIIWRSSAYFYCSCCCNSINCTFADELLEIRQNG